MTRPYVILSAATSLDGYLDDTSPDRLLLSNPADFDRVDEVRASVDAILVGAGTLRSDDPRLLVRSPARRAARVSSGRPANPLRVVVTGSGELDRSLRFWQPGSERLVFTADDQVEPLRARFNGLADVAGATAEKEAGAEVSWGGVLDELGRRGVRRLLVEGGGSVHTQFLALELADELHLVIAPLILGAAGGVAFLGPVPYPGGASARLRLLDARTIGDVVLLRYAPKERR